jgi:hypothetical protein
MNNIQNYWKALLIEWRKEGRDGFTIPFIIGSQKYLIESPRQDIETLIVSIIENEEQECYLKYCITTEDIVLGIKDETKLSLRGYFPPFRDDAIQTKLFLTDYVSDLGKNIETIISSLSERYQHFIDRGEYSKNDRQRGNYSADEKQFIKRVFSDYFEI